MQDLEPSKANFGDVKSSRGKLDINYLAPLAKGSDISHINSIRYSPETDQILLSVRFTNEVVVIDHGTTTAEAKAGVGGKRGKGGDFLYRWGNPQAYRSGGPADMRFYRQHDATWIPARYPRGGHMLVFNNGIGRPGGDLSSVDEIVTPMTSTGDYLFAAGKAFGPAKPVWTYSAPDLLTRIGGSAQRLLGGNTLISSAVNGLIVEVTPAGKEVWRYINPVTSHGVVKQGHIFGGKELSNAPIIMKARRYRPDHPGIRALPLKVQGYVELPKDQ